MKLHLVNCKHGGMARTSTGDDDDHYDDNGILREVEGSSRTETRKTTKPRRNPSLVSLAMGRTATKPADVSSMGSKELIAGLYEGVLIDDNKVKFWIDKDSHENCFMVLAKGLSITWGDNDAYWSWTPDTEGCFRGDVDVYAATLKSVCWLDISGMLPSIMLSPMAKYEVVFVLKKTEGAHGWRMPINLALILPDNKPINRSEDFETKHEEQWLEIQVGEFDPPREKLGNIQFSLSEHGGHWKGGLVVKGVIFRPKHRGGGAGVGAFYSSNK